MNPLAFWERRLAAEHGYMSVTQSIERQFERVRQILESYGIQMTRRETRERLEQIKTPKVHESRSSFLFETCRGRTSRSRRSALIRLEVAWDGCGFLCGVRWG